jgi:hypothetical protein
MKTLPHLVGRTSHQRSKVATAYPKTDSLSELVQQITEADLVSLVETYAGSGKRRGRSTSFLCPLPSHPRRDGKRTPSFVVSTSNGTKVPYWKCYGACGKHGDALDFVEQMEGLSTSQAVPRLRSLLGLAEGSPSVTTRPKATRQAVTSVPTAPKPRNINGDKPSSQEGNEALSRYLAERAWPTEVAELFGLEVITYGGKLWVRHPYHDYDEAGTLIPTAYQDRLLGGVVEGVVVDSRWKTSTGAIGLYRIQHLEADNLEGVVLCEGASDTITATLALADFPSWVAVGVAGAGNYRKEWNALLEGLPVVVAFDNDEAGNGGAVKVANLLGRAVVRKRPELNDLTDEAQRVGLPALGEWLTSSTTSRGISRTTTRHEGASCRICSKPSTTAHKLCGVCSSWEFYGTWSQCSDCGNYGLSKLGRPCHMKPNCSGTFGEVKS